MDDETYEGWGAEIVSTNELKRKRLYFGAHFLSFVLQQDSFGGLSIINRNIALSGEIRKSPFQEATLHLCPLGCIKNRQADPRRIKKGTTKE